MFLIGCGISGISCHHAFLIKQNYKMVCLGQSVLWDSFSGNAANWLDTIQEQSRVTCQLRKASWDTKMCEQGCTAPREKMAHVWTSSRAIRGGEASIWGTGPHLAFNWMRMERDNAPRIFTCSWWNTALMQGKITFTPYKSVRDCAGFGWVS